MALGECPLAVVPYPHLKLPPEAREFSHFSLPTLCTGHSVATLSPVVPYTSALLWSFSSVLNSVDRTKNLASYLWMLPIFLSSDPVAGSASSSTAHWKVIWTSSSFLVKKWSFFELLRFFCLWMLAVVFSFHRHYPQSGPSLVRVHLSVTRKFSLVIHPLRCYL